MMLKFSVYTDGLDGISAALKNATNRAGTAVAVQAAKDTEPYVPMLTGSLTQRTIVDGNQVIYPGPYARYLYYGKVMEGPLYGPKHATDRDLVFTTDFHPAAQSHWFEASKAQNLDKWVRVAKKAVNNER
jgi:hypothetical protein